MSDRPASPVGPIAARRERRGERMVLASFGVTVLTGFLLLILYAIGGETQVEGRPARALPRRAGRRDRPVGAGADVGRAAHRGAAPARHRPGGERRPSPRRSPTRRASAAGGLLQLGLLGALGGLAAALAIPVLSLGPRARAAACSRRRGSRASAWSASTACRSARTRHPAGWRRHRVSRGVRRQRRGPDPAHQRRRRPPPARQAGGGSWAPGGFVAYSKVCTHAGCPVGLYRAAQGELICPCHQSTFDVMRGAVPTFGPAARPLPQLPIQLEADGTSRPWATSRSRSARRSGTWSSAGGCDGRRPPRPAVRPSGTRRHRVPRSARGRHLGRRQRGGRGAACHGPTEPERLGGRAGSTSAPASPPSSGRPCARSSPTTGRSCWARSRCSAS